VTRIEGAEDLLVLARQNSLGEDAERRFEIAVQSSRELELLYRAGVGFDADAELLPGDEKRSALLVARALSSLDRATNELEPRGVAGRSRYGGLVARALASGVLVGLLLSVALASAWEYAEKRLPAHAAEPTLAPASATEKARSARALTAAPAPSSEPSAAIAELALPAPSARAATAAMPPVVAMTNVPRPTPSAPREGPPSSNVESAATLFARANEARRTGDIEAALSQYRELGARYPASAEAEDAKVLIGKLLLSQRSPRAALRELESYHGEALADEALWARAQALRKLGSTEERATLLELVRRHPDSPYAQAARKRLGELGP